MCVCVCVRACVRARARELVHERVSACMGFMCQSALFRSAAVPFHAPYHRFSRYKTKIAWHFSASHDSGRAGGSQVRRGCCSPPRGAVGMSENGTARPFLPATGRKAILRVAGPRCARETLCASVSGDPDTATFHLAFPVWVGLWGIDLQPLSMDVRRD